MSTETVSLLLLLWLILAPVCILAFVIFVARAGGFCDRMARRALDRTRVG